MSSIKPSDGSGFFTRMSNSISNAGKSIGSKASDIKTSINNRFSTRRSENSEKTAKSGRESLQKLSEGMDKTPKSDAKSQHTIKSENSKYKRLKENDDIIENWGMGRIATRRAPKGEKPVSTEKPSFTANIKSMFDGAKNWVTKRRETGQDHSQVKDQSSSVQNMENSNQQLKEILKEDMLLNEALKNPDVRTQFQEYCKNKFCGEQLSAYNALNDVKNNLVSDLTTQDKLEKLEDVFKNCIETDSANEVNIDASYRSRFKGELSNCINNNEVTSEMQKTLDDVIGQVNSLLTLGPFNDFKRDLLKSP